MTVRRPLTLVDKNNFREMTNLGGSSAEMYKIHQKIAYLYAQNPSVALSVVSSGGNISPVMTDEYYFSGIAEDTSNTSHSNPSSQVLLQSVTYDKISQTITSVSTPTYSLKPVRVDGSNSVIEMTETDVIDTFIDPVIDLIVSSTTDVRAAGTYHISTSSSISNHTQLGEVFRDTVSNPGAYSLTFGGTTGSRQTSTTSTSYYLHRNDGVDVSHRLPLIIDGTSGLKEMTSSEFNTYFTALMRAATSGISGHTLSFSVGTNGGGSGTQKGTSMADTRRTSSVRDEDLADPGVADPNDYRVQMWPSGAPVQRASFELMLGRT